jgi:hypothetical protein
MNVCPNVFYLKMSILRLSNSRSIRFLGHALLDQILWQKSDSIDDTKSRSRNVFPPEATSLDFQLSRIEYMFITRGAKEFANDLVDADDWLATMEAMRMGLE